MKRNYGEYEGFNDYEWHKPSIQNSNFIIELKRCSARNFIVCYESGKGNRKRKYYHSCQIYHGRIMDKRYSNMIAVKEIEPFEED